MKPGRKWLSGPILAASFCVATAVSPEETDPFAMTEDDEIAMQQCHEAVRDVRQSGGTARLEDCIGTVSGPCLEVPANQTTIGMVACIARETEWWDGQLNTVYGMLRETLSEKARAEVRDIQRLWIKYKDVKCAFPSTFYEGGTIARPIAADCVLQMTAQRAIELADWLESP